MDRAVTTTGLWLMTGGNLTGANSPADGGLMSERIKQLRRYRRMHPSQKRYWNLVVTIRRKRRKLLNSMDHVKHPRPGDHVRWQAMQTEIDGLEAAKAELDAKRVGLTPASTGVDAVGGPDDGEA